MLLQAAAGGGNWYNLLLMGGIFVVMYFFMIRPQQKKAKDQQKFVDSLKEGDQVVTIGGLHGKIAETTDKTVTLDVGRGTRLTFEKSAISRESSQRIGQ
ncbi:MAG: preprotein translocase subunit YajC [Siphonobacter sp.]